MGRDYKPRPGKGRAGGNSGAKRPPKGKAKPPTPPWVWLSAGFTLGLCVAVGVHLYHQQTFPLAEARAAESGGDGQASTSPREKTRFEFYSLLPEMEVVVPESEVAVRATPSPSIKKDAAKDRKETGKRRTAPARYILQAGAFRSLADADRLRASLALAGLEATIQTVSVDGNEKWHRVRLGPYADVESLNSTRTRLRRASIDAMVLKIKT